MFKKLNRWGVILCLSVCFTLLFTSFALAAQPIRVYVDGHQINFYSNPIIEDGTTLVEFRPIFQELNMQVDYDTFKHVVTGVGNGFNVQLTVGNKYAKVNNKNIELDVSPKIINDHVFIPLRFIGESTGKNVKWDEQTRTINILTGSNSLKTVSPNISTSSNNLLEIKTVQLANDDYNFAFFDDDLAIGISQQADNDGTFKGYLIAIKNLNKNTPLTISQISCVGINKTSNAEIKPSGALYNGKLGAYKLQSNYDLEPNGYVVSPIVFMSNDNVQAIKYNDNSHRVVLDIPNVVMATTTTVLTNEKKVYDIFLKWMTCGLVSFHVPSSVKLLSCNIEYSNTTMSSGTIYCTVSAQNRLGVPIVSYYSLNFNNGSLSGYDESDYPSLKYNKTNVNLDWINAKLRDYWS